MLALLRLPPGSLTPRSYAAFIARLIVLYAGVGAVGGLLSVLALTAHALASAVPERPAPSSVHGCAVTLPNTPGDRDVALVVRTTHPLSECDESAPVAWGASVRDGYTGGRK